MFERERVCLSVFAREPITLSIDVSCFVTGASLSSEDNVGLRCQVLYNVMQFNAIKLIHLIQYFFKEQSFGKKSMMGRECVDM